MDGRTFPSKTPITCEHAIATTYHLFTTMVLDPMFLSGGRIAQSTSNLGGKKCTEGTEMTQTAQLGTPALTRGRQIKFTPERIQQIKNLVERGKGREEIAELIGVTVGSLQVTCSRFGISLRRPTLNNGTFSRRQYSTTSPSRGSKERPEQNTRSGPVAQVQAP